MNMKIPHKRPKYLNTVPCLLDEVLGEGLIVGPRASRGCGKKCRASWQSFPEGKFSTCTSVKIILSPLRRLIATMHCSICCACSGSCLLIIFEASYKHIGLCKFVHYFVEVSVLVC